jgi:hypothetical protein
VNIWILTEVIGCEVERQVEVNEGYEVEQVKEKYHNHECVASLHLFERPPCLEA